MSKTKTIELSEPIGAITKIVLREPEYSDFIELGAPAVWVSLPNGAGFSQETPSVLGAWIERLSGMGLADLKPLCLRDTLELRATILAFFIGASATPPEVGEARAGRQSFLM